MQRTVLITLLVFLVRSSAADEIAAEVRQPRLPAALGAVASTFDASDDGWTSSDGAKALSHEGGALFVRDVTRAWHWLTAPAQFHGDWSLIGKIRLRIRADASAPVHHPVVLELEGRAARASYTVDTRFLQQGEWREISIPLRAASWSVRGGWEDLIDDVTRFRVRLDLHDATEEMETNALDDVRLVPKRASTFERSVGGWTCSGGTVRSEAGRLLVTDVGSGWCWLHAPAVFHGDWSAYTRLDFDVRADERKPVTQSIRLQLDSPHGMALFDLPVEAPGAGRWTALRIPLDEEAWAVSGDWRKMLRDVSGLSIRLDLTTAYSRRETNELDNVRLVR